MKKFTATAALAAALALFGACLPSAPVYRPTGSGETTETVMYVTAKGTKFTAVLEDNAAAAALKEKLPVTITLADNDFEAWGPLGFVLPREDGFMTAHAGDIVLYNGCNICIFYGSNSWSYTRLGKIDASAEELAAVFSGGETEVTLSL